MTIKVIVKHADLFSIEKIIHVKDGMCFYEIVDYLYANRVKIAQEAQDVLPLTETIREVNLGNITIRLLDIYGNN